MYRKVKKIITYAIAVTTFAVTLFSASPVNVNAGQDLVFNESTNSLNGTLTTTGDVNRIEIYYSENYNLANSWLTNATHNAKKTSLSEVVNNGVSLSTEVEIVGGGTTTVPGYPLKCSSFYITSTNQNAEQWNFKIEYNDYISECFIVKAEVPTNWINEKNCITEPLEFSLGYLSSNSSYTADDIIPIISIMSEEKETASDKFQEVEPAEEKIEDPLVAILKLMIGVVFIAIIITVLLYQKTKKANAKRESEEFVKNANKKAKAIKSKENDDLLEIMESYSKYYQEDYEDEEKEDEEYNIMSEEDDNYSDIPVYQEDSYSSHSAILNNNIDNHSLDFDDFENDLYDNDAQIVKKEKEIKTTLTDVPRTSKSDKQESVSKKQENIPAFVKRAKEKEDTKQSNNSIALKSKEDELPAFVRKSMGL